MSLVKRSLHRAGWWRVAYHSLQSLISAPRSPASPHSSWERVASNALNLLGSLLL